MWNFSVPATSAGLRRIKEKLSSAAVKCEHHTSKAEPLSVNTAATAGLASQPHATSPLPVFLLHIQLRPSIILKIKSKSVSIFTTFASDYSLSIFRYFATQSASACKWMPFVFVFSRNPAHLPHKQWRSTMKICFLKTSMTLYLCRILILINVCVYNSNLFAIATISQELEKSPCRNYQETNNNL